MPRDVFQFRGEEVSFEQGQTVLTALMNAGILEFRPGHAPICGMGICFECLVRANGTPVRACMTPAEKGMEVSLDTI